MTFQSRQLKQTASENLQKAKNQREILLLYAAGMLGLSCLNLVIQALVSNGISQTGGLIHMGSRSFLSAVSTFLPVLCSIGNLCLGFGYLGGMLRISRGQYASRNALRTGFERFWPLVRMKLLSIAQLAREHHLLLLADEIYDRLVMDGIPNYSMAALAPDLPCVTFNGLSKSHIICGFRCGWMVFSGPKEELSEVEQGVTALASMRLCGNTLTQLVIPAALSDRQSTRAMMAPGGRLYEQSRATVEGLRKIPGVTQIPNKAACYLFPGLEKDVFDFASDEDFAMRFLHEKHILVIPGHGFDWFEDLRFRIVMLPEPERITRAMEDLAEFLDAHRR